MSGQPVTLLSGAASGIGQRLVSALRGAGHRVVATDIAAERIEASDGVLPLRLDVTSAADWDAGVAAALERWARLDVVMNVAGYLQPAYVQDVADRDIDLHFDVNLKGVVLGTRAAARHMVKQGYGHIVNVGSLASLAPVGGLSLYAASKFGVRGFSLAAAQDLEPHGVSVSLVMPDAVDTPMLDKQVGYDEAAMTFSGSRALTVDEVAAAIVGQVLRNKPLELTIPASRGRLARLVNVVPDAAAVLAPLMRRLGARHQKNRRR